MSLFATLLIGGGALWLNSLKQASDRLNVSILNVWKGKITGGKLILWAKVELGNHSNTAINLRQPDIKVTLNDNPVGQSPPDNTMHPIAPGKAISIDVPFEIPLLNIPFAVAALLRGDAAGRLVKVTVATKFNGINYSDTYNYNL